jgi:hypothetical protein
MIELPGVRESGMPRRNGQRKPGTTRGAPAQRRHWMLDAAACAGMKIGEPHGRPDHLDRERVRPFAFMCGAYSRLHPQGRLAEYCRGRKQPNLRAAA